MRANLDRVERVEHVELGDGEVREAVHHGSLADHRGVEPAAAAVTARRGTVLVADLAEGVARLVQELRREGAVAHAGRVGLDHAPDLVQGGRTNAGAAARVARDGVARGHERVGALVHVEDSALGTLEHQALARLHGLVEHLAHVGDERLDLLAELEVVLDDHFGVDRRHVVHHGKFFVVDLRHRLDARAQFAFVHQVAHAHTDAVDLIAVARADAAARRADGSLARLLLLRLVERGVVREHHVGVVRDKEAAFGVDALRVEVRDFREGLDRVENDAVADNTNLVSVHNARRDQVEHELLVAHLNSMACVRPALEAHDDVCVQSQEVHNLGLTFVTPLGTDYNTICHISFIFCDPQAKPREAARRSITC